MSQWRRKEINIAGAKAKSEGPKLETRRAVPVARVLGEGVYRSSPPSRGFTGAL